MSTDDTPVVAIRQACAALRAGTVTRALDSEDLGLLGTEARTLVEQLVDVLQSVDRATTDPRDPHTHDLSTLRERLAGALAPSGVGGDPRAGVDDQVEARSGTPDD
jgi:hypothetical protein